MGLLRGTRRALLGGGAKVKYLLRATFNAADQGYANAQVLDSVAEGISDGQLTVVEVDGTLAIVSNKCAFTAQATAGWGDLGFYSGAVTKTLGRSLIASILANENTSWAHIGWKDTTSVGTAGATEYDFQMSSPGKLDATGPGTVLQPRVGTFVVSTTYELAIVLGGYDANGVPWRTGETAASYLYGAAYYVKGGAYTTWTLLYRHVDGNVSTLYAAFSNQQKTGTIDDFRVPDVDLSAVLQPTCLSTFTAANSTSLDAITPEVGNAWTEQQGDWEIQSNKAQESSPADKDSATIDTGISDFLVDATVVGYHSGSDIVNPKVLLRFTDLANYWILEVRVHDNSIKITERTGDVETNRASVGVTINSATAYDARAIAYAQTIDMFLDGANKISYASAASNETETLVGIMVGVGGTPGANTAKFDNFAVYRRDGSVYDNALDAV
jgi:hypothetical protein